MSMIRHPHHRLAGFSIGEVLLAGFVLAVGIVSVVGLMGASFAQSSESQKLIIASELAQEGIELVRNVRDNQIAAKANGDATVTNVLATLNGLSNKNQCRIDYNSTITCALGSATGLKLGGNFYDHQGSGDDLFYRRIKIESGADTNNGLRIYSFVAWRTPLPSNFDSGSPSNAIASCTTANHCVYTEHLLTPWK